MKNIKKSTVRIIGGKWRGRKIDFIESEGLRPTHDRVRETLFNWLQFDINGARCLDLFAGSGALGIEALSRGAAHVVFVDKEKKVVDQLRENIFKMSTDNADVFQFDFTNTEAIMFNEPFNIVFLDPPFHTDLLQKALKWLSVNHLLATNAMIYLETALGDFSEEILLNDFEILKHKKTKALEYLLCRQLA